MYGRVYTWGMFLYRLIKIALSNEPNRAGHFAILYLRTESTGFKSDNGP